jgi:hypothetical protein
MHLQIKTDCAPLWHKENMINMGVKNLLPDNWKAMAWIDMDIEFETPYWALNALKILNGNKDIVQLFKFANDMDNDGSTMHVHSGFGYRYVHSNKYTLQINPQNAFHPGYGWAYTRKAYEKLGGILDLSILGSGDFGMAMCLIGKGEHSLNSAVTSGYKRYVKEYESKALGFRIGYIPGSINHYFHGSKVKRYYGSRWLILVNNKFDPYTHLEYNKEGLVVPTKKMPPKLLKDIMEYFTSRKEDDPV